MAYSTLLLKDVLLLTKDGEWGRDVPTDGTVETVVIRGTDFALARTGDLSGAPTRFIDAHLLQRKRLQPGDTLIETAGGTKNQPTGRSLFVRDELFADRPQPLMCASFARFLRPNPKVVFPEYLYWWLQWLYASGQMEQHQVQHTGIARFQYTKFAESVSILLPSIEQQRAIASVLGALDRKVALNRCINQTLEAIAQALFKSWFVDVDPVRAKAEGGKPEGMDSETAALFSSRLSPDQFGELPEGWTWAPLDRVGSFLNGLALQKYPPEDEDALPVLKIAQLRAGTVEGADGASAKLPREYVIDDGDVIFSWSGSLLVSMWAGGRCALNQHLFKIGSAEFPLWFVHHWCLHHLPEFQRIAAAKATTMGHIQRHHLSEAMVAVPSSRLIEAADHVFAPLWGKWLLNAQESRALASLRDALLPKLLSGEIRVTDAGLAA